MEGTSPSSCVFSVGDEKEIGEESTEGVASVKGVGAASTRGSSK